jgi:GT2 family glycosyltransferase
MGGAGAADSRELGSLQRLAGCWVRLSARLEAQAAAWPRLELDRGAGFESLHSLPLPGCAPGGDRIDYVFFLPRGTHRARIACGEPCTLANVAIQPVSAAGAAARMFGAVAAADGLGAAARAALALPGEMRAHGAGRRVTLLERYGDLCVRRGGTYAAWLKAFEPRVAKAVVELGADYVARVAPGDELHPLAHHYVAQALRDHAGAGLIYTDEDRVDAHGQRSRPWFKCEPNYELLLAQDMVGGLAVYRRSLVADLLPGASDHELALRAFERLQPHEIVHIPRVLYHRRGEPGGASRAAVEGHLGRRGVRAIVEDASEAPGMLRVRFPMPEPAPLVSIVIATRERANLLARCLESVARSTYVNRELIVVDNGSTSVQALSLLERQRATGVRVLRDEAPFNFSALNNRAVREARGDFVCLLNNDVELLTPGWLEEMLSFAAQPGTGAVGARLWYPDGRLQHGGVVLGLAGDHAHRGVRRGDGGYFSRAVLHQCFSAVTGACLLVRKSAYEEVGGLDERLAVSFNDVDFCLRLRAAGYRNVWTPYAEATHLESASRRHSRSAADERRLAQETKLMEERWGALLFDDPAYSPNLSLDARGFMLAWPPRSR